MRIEGPPWRTVRGGSNRHVDANARSLQTRIRLNHPVRAVQRFQNHLEVRLYTFESLDAQKRYDEVSGVNRRFFCGAYWGHGFLEDGINSALAACKHFGKGL